MTPPLHAWPEPALLSGPPSNSTSLSSLERSSGTGSCRDSVEWHAVTAHGVFCYFLGYGQRALHAIPLRYLLSWYTHASHLSADMLLARQQSELPKVQAALMVLPSPTCKTAGAAMTSAATAGIDTLNTCARESMRSVVESTLATSSGGWARSSGRSWGMFSQRNSCRKPCAQDTYICSMNWCVWDS